MKLIRSWLDELERLVIPMECPGCGSRDVLLCGSCARWLSGPLHRVEHQVPRLDDLTDNPPMPVWALGEYTESARGMVVAWKDKGREDLTKVYRNAIVAALAQTRQTELFPKVDVVVPMPSSAASVRHRGRDHLQTVSQAIGQTLNAKSVRALTKRSHRDQVGLSARDRGGAKLALRRTVKMPVGARILLFDDVVTTGATLAAARDILSAAGYDVVGAVVLAATPPRKMHDVSATLESDSVGIKKMSAFSTRLSN